MQEGSAGEGYPSIHCAHVLDEQTVRTIKTGTSESGQYLMVEGVCTKCRRRVRQMEFDR